jgi:hypothetical protein
MNRRGFIGCLTAALAVPLARRVYVLAPPGGWRADGDKLSLEQAIQQINEFTQEYVVPRTAKAYHPTEFVIDSRFGFANYIRPRRLVIEVTPIQLASYDNDENYLYGYGRTVEEEM